MVVAIVVLGMNVSSISVGRPHDFSTMKSQEIGPLSPQNPDVRLDMNDDISWKDANSYRRMGTDYTMQMDQAVLWNTYDYAQAEDIGQGHQIGGNIDAHIYCLGARLDTSDSEIQLIWTDVFGEHTESAKTCTKGTWTDVKWSITASMSTWLYFKFKLYSGFVIYGPNSGWSSGAVMKIVYTSTYPGTDYYFMGGITFHDVDSCGDYRTDCGSGDTELHSEVDNHVVFLHSVGAVDYFITDWFTVDNTGNHKIYLNAACLTDRCGYTYTLEWQGPSSGSFSPVEGWFQGEMDWKYLYQHTLNAGGPPHNWRYKLTLQNTTPIGYSESHIAWKEVGIDYDP